MGLIQGSVSQNTARLRSFIYFWDASPSQEWKILNNMTKVRYIPLIDTNNPSYDWNGTLSAMLTNINNVIKNNYGSYNSNTTNGYTWSASNSPTGRVAESMLEATSPGYYEVDVPHNSDGTKPDCLLACSFSLPSGGYGPGNVNISGQVALASIPRASEVTVPAGNIGEAVSININKYSVGFTSTLKYECGALNGTIVEKTPQSTWGWIIPESFYELIPNASSIQCKIICETYNGSTLLGTKETFFTANANPITNAPELSAVITDINSKTLALTGSSEKFVRFISNARAVITASAKNFATVATRKFDCADGKTGLGTSVDLIAVESGDFTVSTIDSRGFSKAVSYTKDLVEYIKLTANASFKRNLATDNKVKLSFNGNYFNNTFGAVANTLQVKYRYKKTTDLVWSALYTLTPIISGNGYSGANIILAPGGVQTVFTYADAWEFELYAYDKIYDATGIVFKETVGPGEPNFAIGKDFFEHYTDVFVRKNMDVAGNLITDGKIINDIIPAETYLALVDVSEFVVTSQFALNQTLPQTIPISKLNGSLTVASNILTLPKGYIYEFYATPVGTGTGRANVRMVNHPSNVAFGQIGVVVIPTSVVGVNGSPVFAVKDLTLASADEQVKLANVYLDYAVTLEGGDYSRIFIKKYKKITV